MGAADQQIRVSETVKREIERRRREGESYGVARRKPGPSGLSLTHKFYPRSWWRETGKWDGVHEVGGPTWTMTESCVTWMYQVGSEGSFAQLISETSASPIDW